MGTLGPFHIASRYVKWYSCHGNQTEEHHLWSCNSSSEYIPQTKTRPHSDLGFSIPSGTPDTSQQYKIQASTKRWTSKQWHGNMMGCYWAFTGIKFEKMEQPWEHCIELNKPIKTKICDSTHRSKVRDLQKLDSQSETEGAARAWSVGLLSFLSPWWKVWRLILKPQ